MDENNKIQLFEDKKVRVEWDEENEKWWFSVVDVIGVLTDNDYQTARKYWKNLKSRMLKEGADFQLVTDCYQLKMQADDGKMRDTDVAKEASQKRQDYNTKKKPEKKPFRRVTQKILN